MYEMKSLLIILAVIVVVILLVTGIVAVQRTRKLDQLHKKVARSRIALEKALLSRSQAAQDYAQTGELDMASAVLLSDIAHEARQVSVFPIVPDGVTRIKIYDDGGADVVAQQGIRPDRLAIESELSRILRLVIEGCQPHSPELTTLEQARNAVRMTRRFHNIHAARAIKVRKTFLARTFLLYGSAPCPTTVDLDDE